MKTIKKFFTSIAIQVSFRFGGEPLLNKTKKKSNFYVLMGWIIRATSN